ncbi:MAG: ImmA/IrrE family metallo-endopeptidase [Ruminococcaceae bacterium]|nr:ImmA/IrrE family metallo-endopeptidase [Oscillospiraceae bacterium]
MAKTKDPAAVADKVIYECNSRDPERIARQNGIMIREVEWKEQSGAYIEMMRQPVIFVAERLDPVMRSIVIAHELGHHFLHKKEAAESGGFREFKIFDMMLNNMEYEANTFAAQLLLPDDEIKDLIYEGYDVAQIASIMNSDINLVALKVSGYIKEGSPFRKQEYKNKFY